MTDTDLETLTVRNLTARPVDLGGPVLTGHRWAFGVPDDEHVRALVDDGTLGVLHGDRAADRVAGDLVLDRHLLIAAAATDEEATSDAADRTVADLTVTQARELIAHADPADLPAIRAAEDARPRGARKGVLDELADRTTTTQEDAA